MISKHHFNMVQQSRNLSSVGNANAVMPATRHHSQPAGGDERRRICQSRQELRGIDVGGSTAAVDETGQLCGLLRSEQLYNVLQHWHQLFQAQLRFGYVEPVQVDLTVLQSVNVVSLSKYTPRSLHGHSTSPQLTQERESCEHTSKCRRFISWLNAWP
jgi:hypothetical protein